MLKERKSPKLSIPAASPLKTKTERLKPRLFKRTLILVLPTLRRFASLLKQRQKGRTRILLSSSEERRILKKRSNRKRIKSWREISKHFLVFHQISSPTRFFFRIKVIFDLNVLIFKVNFRPSSSFK